MLSQLLRLTAIRPTILSIVPTSSQRRLRPDAARAHSRAVICPWTFIGLRVLRQTSSESERSWSGLPSCSSRPKSDHSSSIQIR